jgi:glycosyltransferase involved in cell wall biosynthesis
VKVGVDGRSLAGGEAGRGVAHYTSALLAAMAAQNPHDEWHVLLLGAGRDPRFDAPNIVLHRRPAPARPLRAAAALVGRPRFDVLLGTRPDVFWAPAPSPIALSRGVPLVLTVHDLSWEERPRDFTPYERAWHQVSRPRALARRAARIVAVSGATRAAALAIWGLDPERVAVAPSGVDAPAATDAAAVARARERHGLPPRYIVFVGALEPRKAPDLLVRAFARAREHGLDADLALVGTGRLGPALRAPGVHHLGAVDAATRDALLAGAVALVLPSWLEGFGFPPLEALGAGTPPVVSDLEVYRETLGAGALRFPPGDEHRLAEALVRIAADAQLREEIVTAGRAAMVPLTWTRAAELTRAALAAAAGVP